MNLSTIIKDVSLAAKKHSPEILTGIGIAGMITTTIMAVKATPKALILMEEEKRRQNKEKLEEAFMNGNEECEKIEKLKPVDVIKTTWTCYLPAFAVGTASVLCLVGASRVNLRRNAALATAYALSESAFKEYQEKVVEEIGEKKERAVRDAVAKERIDNDPVTNREVIITEKGNTLCYEVISGRYFKTDRDALVRAANDLNRRMRDEMYISLNEWYYEIGLKGVKVGDDLGWNIDRSYIELDFSSQLADDGTPCLVVDYVEPPIYDYK